MRKVLVVVAVSACGGSSKPAPAPPPAASAPAEKPDPVAVASDPEEGGQVASAAVASGGVAASADDDRSTGPAMATDELEPDERGAGVMAAGPGGGASGGAAVGGARLRAEPSRADVKLQPGEPKVTGDIDRAALKRVINAHRAQVRYCYEKALTQNPSLRGRVTVTFTIEKDGKVSAAKADGVDAGLDACVAGRFRTWTFPASASVSTIVYPVVFEPG
jgi:outer membrane biosynthesis protein TonB